MYQKGSTETQVYKTPYYRINKLTKKRKHDPDITAYTGTWSN